MTRSTTFFPLAWLVFVLTSLAGCAAPGDPAPRTPVIPAAITDLSAHQYGNSVSLSFSLPTRSTKRNELEERPTVDIYRAAVPLHGKPDKQTPWRLAYTIPSEQLDTYLRGDKIEFNDPFGESSPAGMAGNSFAYKVRTREEKARDSQDSNIVTTRLYPAPEPPGDVRISVTESALVVSWSETSLPSDASGHSYHVYRAEVEPGQEFAPLNLATLKLKAPLELAGSTTGTEFHDGHFEFGTDYLYTVRSVAQYAVDFAESADSQPVSVTPQDTFPPAVPTGLEAAIIPATEQGTAYIELSWAISPEGDLAGYVVYRSDREDTDGERVNQELLPSPTFRDISVLPGKRYYYRVSAVDRAGNESPRCPAVQADVP